MTVRSSFERLREATPPLLLVAVALVAGAVYGYLRGRYGPAVAFGLGAILASLFVVLTDS